MTKSKSNSLPLRIDHNHSEGGITGLLINGSVNYIWTVVKSGVTKISRSVSIICPICGRRFPEIL